MSNNLHIIAVYQESNKTFDAGNMPYHFISEEKYNCIVNYYNKYDGCYIKSFLGKVKTVSKPNEGWVIVSVKEFVTEYDKWVKQEKKHLSPMYFKQTEEEFVRCLDFLKNASALTDKIAITMD
jgi:hypothetical protein